jgi:hypothetical protein
MSATYAKTSPYHGTPLWGKFLDVWTGKTIDPDVTDVLYQIDPVYLHRPDLLAYDSYKDSAYWWIFAVRNPDVIRDPVFDFIPGRIIYVPTLAVIKNSLGS